MALIRMNICNTNGVSDERAASGVNAPLTIASANTKQTFFSTGSTQKIDGLTELEGKKTKRSNNL